MISVKLVGFNRVANRLRKATRQMPKTIDRITGEHARELRGHLKAEPYPAKRPSRTYRRTGRLANSFSAKRERMGEWSIKNSALYSQYVIDKQRQAWMHKGRWWTVQDIERRYRPQLTQKLTKAVKAELDE